MDRASACGAEGLGFDPYWAQVSVGGFLDCAHVSLLSPWSNGYDLSASFRKKKNPHPDPALCGILGVSFTFRKILVCCKPFFLFSLMLM